MDLHFCRYYAGNGYPPSNRFCRVCPHAWRGCDALWERVVELAGSNGTDPLPLPGTRAVLFPHPNSPYFVRLRVNVEWNLPSMTRQEPYVGAIVEMLGVWQCDEVARVRRIQGRDVSDPDASLR
jgi:hypothetical protein